MYCWHVQAVKQKLHIKPRLQLPDALLPKLTGRDPEADKAKLLMGDTLSVCSLVCTTACRLLLQPFYDPLSGTTQVSRYQNDKPFWILLKQT